MSERAQGHGHRGGPHDSREGHAGATGDTRASARPGPASAEGGGVMRQELPAPEVLAPEMVEQLEDERGGEAVEDYLYALVGEVFDLVPGIRERFVDAVLAELCEEVAEREDSRHAHATTTLIQEIQKGWEQNS